MSATFLRRLVRSWTQIKWAAAGGIVLLVLLIVHSPLSQLKPSAEQRQKVSPVTLLHNYSVWPHSDVDNDDDRILSQIAFMNDYARQKRNRKLKIILRVGSINFKDWAPGQELFWRHGCPVVDCWMTKNQSLARDADALLISMFYQSTCSLYLPKPRRQIWIAQHREPPSHNRIDTRAVRGLINWTASYRHDSTIAYGFKMLPGLSAGAAVIPGERSFNYAVGKTKLVAWFVSNCYAVNKRIRYAKELSQFIQV